MLEFAARVGISIEQPFRKLSPDAKQQLLRGDSGSDFDGVSGFLKRLRRREQQPSIRRYLAQWCEVRECSACSGTGLRSAALAVRLIDAASQIRLTFADCLAHPIDELLVELRHWATTLSTTERDVAKNLLPELFGRLEFLVDLGLGRLSLGRSLDTLSHGEAQRVALSGIFASRLVNTLFVLDEPSAGLHDRDFERVILGLRRLRDAGNTVVVIEHEAAFLQAADHNIEIGPAAGSEGGQLIYSGDFAGLCECAASPTAAMWQLFPAPLAPVLRGEGRGGPDKNRERRPPTSWLELTGVEHHSLHDFNVRLPLGCLCVVTGVSGSGKSLLIQETLWPALCQTLQQPCDVASPGRFKALLGAERLDDVQLVDDSPLQGGSRSNPSTWLKLFDEIRRLYAESPEAKQRGLTASYFSFNNDRGGRCPKCKGTGSVAIDMQFLADVVMHCPECHGSRFRREALEVTWRSLSIADVLAMTTSDAFVFFKGQPSLQKRLKSLKDVGLGYLTLGQPLNTLSGGEAQRLKLAATLSRTSRARTLLLMNEPTTGLHPRDVERLLECFRNLVNVGHSLIVIEHSRQVIEAADYVVEMPEGGSESRSD